MAISASGPDAIIYKTRGDYFNLVPVILNEEKTEIVSFPAPGDLTYKGKPATPYILADGFLLDNRGITENAGFLSITYEEYSAMADTPGAGELMEKIVDSDPFISMYNCGKRQLYKNEIDELNAHILDNDFDSFVKLTIT